ncbi:hypothetical protein PC122_g6677 [Phytophthora cactorum]|nr:hypothetical protein PC122_g6677 [Phytophthora cactorum]
MLRTCHDPPVHFHRQNTKYSLSQRLIWCVLVCLSCRERYKERDRSRSVYYRVIGCSKRLHGFNSSAVEYNLFDQLLLISEAGHLLEKLQAAWARCGWRRILRFD